MLRCSIECVDAFLYHTIGVEHVEIPSFNVHSNQVCSIVMELELMELNLLKNTLNRFFNPSMSSTILVIDYLIIKRFVSVKHNFFISIETLQHQ